MGEPNIIQTQTRDWQETYIGCWYKIRFCVVFPSFRHNIPLSISSKSYFGWFKYHFTSQLLPIRSQAVVSCIKMLIGIETFFSFSSTVFLDYKCRLNEFKWPQFPCYSTACDSLGKCAWLCAPNVCIECDCACRLKDLRKREGKYSWFECEPRYQRGKWRLSASTRGSNC